MRVREEAEVAEAALPVADLAGHLRLTAGEAGLPEVGQLVAYLRASLAAIEGRIGKALIARDFTMWLPFWRTGDRQALPLAPVSEVLGVVVRDDQGFEVEVPPARWRLEADDHRPHLVARGVSLPAVPEGGVAEVRFQAGFGAWAQVPADLRQAVLLLAAQYHEYRHDPGVGAGGLPFGILALIERWRIVRVMGGGR